MTTSPVILATAALGLISCAVATRPADAQPRRTVPQITEPVSGAPAALKVVRVQNGAELRAALAAVRPGTRIVLAPGEYPGGYWCTNVTGEPGRPIVIAAADPTRPPVIKGGSGGIQLAGSRYVELWDIDFEEIKGNALAIDDGGAREHPARHILIRNVRFRDIGPSGNHHAIKLAGVDDFRIEDCRFDRWSGGDGIAIDAVGCHRGVVERCQFRGNAGPANRSFGALQFKGASADILIRRCRFDNPGLRAINIGGGTGIPYFRPPLESWPGGENRYEAKNIRVEGNTFIGADAPVAFVNVDGAVVRFNTIYRPERWALRILQENRLPGFGPSRNGVFSDNLIVFESTKWPEGVVNIGPGTAPASFAFARNFWCCTDATEKSRPLLPVPEAGGVYGQVPLFRAAADGDLRQLPRSPARKYGAEALP